MTRPGRHGAHLLPEHLTAQVSAYCVVARSQELPRGIAERAKWVFLDEIGCMILGSTMLPGVLIREHILSLKAQGGSSLVGSELPVPMPLAALSNGTANHADELDGTHISEGHPGAVIVPAALAVAESEGRSGQDLLAAICLGYDISTRLVDAIGGRIPILRSRHLHSGVVYAIGAAAAAGHLLDLNAEQYAFGFALALQQVNIPAAFFEERDHISKAINCGQAAYAGVSGAMMAKRGFTAAPDIFGSDHGALAMWSDSPKRERVVERLGEEYTILGSNFKLYSAGYPIHSPIAICLRILATNGLTADLIDRIDVYMNSSSAEAVDNREMPSICLQDMLSVAIVVGRLDFEHAHDQTLLDRPDVVRLRNQISVIKDPELDTSDMRGRGARVELTTSDGRTLRDSQQFPPGHSRANDMSWDLIADKFRHISNPRIGVERASGLVDLAFDLERQPNLSRMSELLRLDLSTG